MHTSKLIIIKPWKTSDDKKILKAAGETTHIIFRGTKNNQKVFIGNCAIQKTTGRQMSPP